MNIEEIIKYFGGITATAKVLGVSRQTVHNWRRCGAMPEHRARYAEMIIGKGLSCE